MRNAVHGHVDARFDKVADALAEEFSSGAEVGAAIAVKTPSSTSGRAPRP